MCTGYFFRISLTAIFISACRFSGSAQDRDTLPDAKHAAINFPYPMYRDKWRTSLGVSFLFTPEDITEEVQIAVPAIDFRALRKISDHLVAEGRINAQVVQNQLIMGLNYVAPISNHFYFSVGAGAGFWFGFINFQGFDSKGSGWLGYPNASFGWRSNRNLLVTLRAQSTINLYYKAYNGKVETSAQKWFYNGETYTISLEQAFYKKHHLTLSFSAINNYFFWQTWVLFYQVDRKIYYPQVTVGFIL